MKYVNSKNFLFKPKNYQPLKKYAICFLVFCFISFHNEVKAQHTNTIEAKLLDTENTIQIKQEITYYNQSQDTLHYVLLNDWNNSFSSNKSPLANRFSDEFIRNFYISRKSQRGFTKIDSVSNALKNNLKWERTPQLIDVVKVYLKTPLYPNQKTIIQARYTVKLPSAKFTQYGFSSSGYNLKEWFLFPCKYSSKKGFEAYSNLNLDDASYAPANYFITLKSPVDYIVTTDLNAEKIATDGILNTHKITGTNRIDAKLVLEKKTSYQHYKNNIIEVVTNLEDVRLHEPEKSFLIDKITNYVANNVGSYQHKTILITQEDYARNPFYGLNQLPSFISPFSDEFQYEIKFLKTYLNVFLQSSLQINNREDHWLIDAIQMYYIQKYIEINYPNTKMLGDISSIKLLKSFHLTAIDFNEQYHYLYLFLARRNIDQPIGDSKEKLIRFNEKITGKYKAGLALHYLDSYLEQNVVDKSIQSFYEKSSRQAVSSKEFEQDLKQNTPENIDWFFEHLVSKRDIIDYSFGKTTKIAADSTRITIKNLTNTTVPIPLYGITNNTVVFKKWLTKIATDSTFVLPTKGIEKLVLNYKKEVPEYNVRNNWKNLNNKLTDRPFKFTFFTDVENPAKKQLFYVPIADYNLYNGVYLGLRLHNKSLIVKPFEIDVNPSYSAVSNSLIGSMSVSYNQYIRNNNLYAISYYLSASQFDYTADAKYYKLNPAISFTKRTDDFRNNHRERFSAKYVLIHREKSTLAQTSSLVNYGVFNLKYNNNKSELLHYKGLNTDLQFSENFGKASVEFGYRYLLKTNQQLYFRLYAGTFLYRNLNTRFFDFALDRPTDYLFEYNYYGRSEDTGIYSQQIIIAEGGFKSKLNVPLVNQWMTTANFGMNIWNWFEVYGDVGLVKNKSHAVQFLYDSGIKLNLVPDFFELYFPVNSSNGWEISQPNYSEKIRFIITLNPTILVRLYTRKWF